MLYICRKSYLTYTVVAPPVLRGGASPGVPEVSRMGTMAPPDLGEPSADSQGRDATRVLAVPLEAVSVHVVWVGWSSPGASGW